MFLRPTGVCSLNAGAVFVASGVDMRAVRCWYVRGDGRWAKAEGVAAPARGWMALWTSGREPRFEALRTNGLNRSRLPQ